MPQFHLDSFLPYELAQLSEQVSREFSALYRERFGISIPEWRVMANLSQAGTLSVREIHTRAGMDKSKVSRAAARLETAGYVAKTVDPVDRRLVALSLTEAGRGLIEEMTPLARAYEAQVLDRLGAGAAPFRDGIRHLLDG